MEGVITNTEDSEINLEELELFHRIDGNPMLGLPYSLTPQLGGNMYIMQISNGLFRAYYRYDSHELEQLVNHMDECDKSDTQYVIVRQDKLGEDYLVKFSR